MIQYICDQCKTTIPGDQVYKKAEILIPEIDRVLTLQPALGKHFCARCEPTMWKAILSTVARKIGELEEAQDEKN